MEQGPQGKRKIYENSKGGGRSGGGRSQFGAVPKQQNFRRGGHNNVKKNGPHNQQSNWKA